MRDLGRVEVMLLVLVSAAWATPEHSPLPLVMANNNRTPAGQLKNGVLELQLEVSRGRWYPEEEGGGYRDVYAFSEAGHAPQSSGPLIRVPQGTEIHVTVHNALPLTARVYGLHRHPGDAGDALRLAPGKTRELQFLAGEPGTYLYWATTSDKSLQLRADAETMLSGAFVVDTSGTKPDDFIFVLGLWTKDPAAGLEGTIVSINGKSWPYTDRLTYKIGETIHWRVINATESDHAMHLHGFYFTVDGEGDGEHYESYSEEQRPRAVTQHVDPGHVFELTWTPERGGNWLFHCHMLVHMSPPEALAPKERQPGAHSPASLHDQRLGMGGMVIGITVLPGRTSKPSPAAATTTRKLQLLISENPGKIPLYKLEVNDLLKPSALDRKAPSLLRPPIVLTRGEPTEIDVKNESSNPTVIHWHGIEVENYYDGVAGWTGSGRQTTPPVAPGRSFVAHITPPRPGTFIYHTHWHDDSQLLNGLYGPLIVLDQDKSMIRSMTEHSFFSACVYPPFGYLLLVNGHPEPDPVKLHPSILYRFRLINITDNAADLRVRLTNKGVPVQWKVIAKDGAALPPAQLRSSR